MGAPSFTPLRSIAEIAPGAHDAIERMHAAAWDAVPANLLELARLRIAAALGAQDELAARTPGAGITEEQIAALDNAHSSPLFTPIERAVIAYADQYAVSVSTITDEMVAPITAELGSATTYELANALYALDATMRLRLALARTLELA